MDSVMKNGQIIAPCMSHQMLPSQATVTYELLTQYMADFMDICVLYHVIIIYRDEINQIKSSIHPGVSVVMF
jgi:hypothetical protein